MSTDMDKKSVMILDGNTREALAIVRSFGRKNISVFVGGYSKLSRAFYSRYCREHFLYPLEDGSPINVHNEILHYVKKFRPNVLMPVLNKTFSIIIKYREEYLPYTRLIPLPTYEAFSFTEDKSRLTKLALKNGISIPATFYPKNLDEVRDLKKSLPYPLLVKPRISAGGFGIYMVVSPQELLERYTMLVTMRKISFLDAPFDNSLPMLQEYISGKLINFYAYCEKGEVKAIFMTQTLRGYPVRFGPGIAAVSMKNELIKEISLKLIRLLEWEGIIGFQYIIDEQDGTPRLIDSNPRFWGTVENAIFSGIDFPYLLFRKAIGKEVDFCLDYEEGRKFRWVLFGELFYLLQSENKLRTIVDYLQLRNTHCEVSLADIKPHIIHVLSLLKNRTEVR